MPEHKEKKALPEKKAKEPATETATSRDPATQAQEPPADTGKGTGPTEAISKELHLYGFGRWLGFDKRPVGGK